MTDASDPRDDEDYGLDEAMIERLHEAIEAGDAARIDALLEDLHAADIADIFSQISASERRDLLRLWSREIDGEILTEIDEAIREEVIDALPPEVLAEAVRELDSDDVVDLIEALEEPQQEQILQALEADDRAAVEQSLTYPEHSAGRLMQREVVTAPEHWTVGEAIDYLRHAEELPDQFYHVILIDPRWHPVGYVTLGRILSSGREVRLADITEDSFRTIPATQEEADVAYAFNQYHLISAPVVDENDRLVGVITIDDAMAVLDEEHEEDVLKLAGVSEDSAISDGILETVKMRVPWLLINLITANIAAFVVSRFEGTIGAIVALAALMPIVAGLGGNAGTQSLAVAVRALATRDLTGSNAARVVRREAVVGVLNGVVLGAIMGTVALAFYGSFLLGAVIGAALIFNLMLGALAGVVVPLLLDRFDFDPALASGIFVTALTDTLGFLAFLGLATWVLL